MLGQHGIRGEINKLIRFYFDAKEDYRLAARRAGDDVVRRQLERRCEEREAFHHQLQEAVTKLAVEMSDNGTMSADFKRDWERLRGSIAGHGFDAALQLAATSDGHAIEQAQRLVNVGLPPSLLAIIQRQLPSLRKASEELNALTTGHAPA